MTTLEHAIRSFGVSLRPFGIPCAYYMLYWSYARRAALADALDYQWEALVLGAE